VSKYEELDADFKACSKAARDYRMKCFGFLEKAAEGFRKFIEAPEDTVKWRPIEDTKPDTIYSVAGVYFFDEDDSICAKAVLELPSTSLSFIIKTEYTGGIFKVRFGNFPDVLEIKSDNPQDTVPISEWLWRRMKETCNVNAITAPANDGEKIGFDISHSSRPKSSP
jgi:hypothetical protein